MKSSTREDRAIVVACLGSSSTAGKGQAFNWIHELERRLNKKRFVFRNFGIGGDLARRVQEFSAIIQEVAVHENTKYIALYESLSAEIMKSPGRAFSQFRFLPFYRDAFRTVLFRKSPDEVGRMNGWRFHTDGVHLNSRSGLIVADLVQEFLES